jgi:molecular chaperone GrpE (heat shock protein)
MPGLKQVISGLNRLLARITLPRLITAAERVRLKDYDALGSNVAGLQQALATQQRALDEAHRQLDSRREEAKRLQTDYLALVQRLEQTATAGSESTMLDVYSRLQSVIVQLPTLRSSVAEGAPVSAADVLGVVAPLEEMFRDFGFEMIGEANQELAFDPRYHHLAGDQTAPHAGERVRVTYVGYRFEGRVLCRAEVTRVEQKLSA